MLGWVPNAVPATAQVLLAGDQIAVWVLPVLALPKRIRPSNRTIEAQSLATKLTVDGLSSAVI